MNEVKYIIINVYNPKDVDYDLTDIVNNQFFDTEQDAWDALYLIAESYSVTLDPEESQFDAPLGSLLNENYYYIEDLYRG